MNETVRNEMSNHPVPVVRWLLRVGTPLLAGLGLAAAVQAQDPPRFTCDASMMQSIGPGSPAPDTLNLINTGSNPLVYQPIGTGSVSYNAHGYNPADNYIYGIQTPTNNLVRIHADGSTLVLGPVTGLPVNGYQAGEVSPAGVLYVRNQNTPTMYAINLNALPALVATPIPLSGAVVPWQDMAWHDGLLYAASPPPAATTLRSINPNTGLVTNVGASGISGSSIGALFGTPSGVYGASNGGGFYRFDTTNGRATLISASPPATNNDGSHCATAEISFASDLAITKTNTPASGTADLVDDTYVPGGARTYTIVVSNLGAFGAQNVRVQDALPTGIATATWTCVANNGAVCRTAGGTNAIDARVDIPYNAIGPAATVTFTLTMTVPTNYSGNLINTATVTPGEGNTDANPANNTATDNDAQALAELSISKTNNVDSLVPGATTTYVVAVTNTGLVPVYNATIRDDWTSVPGLDCSAGPASCAVSGAAGSQCPLAAAVTPAALQAGLLIPLLTVGGVTTFSLTCAVTASGF